MCSLHVTRESVRAWGEKKRKQLIEGEEVRQARFKQNAFHAELTDDVNDFPPPRGPKTFRLDEKKKRGSLPRFSVDSGRRGIVRLRQGTDRVAGSWSDTDKRQFAYLEDIVGPPIDADRLASILRQSESRTLRSSRRNSPPDSLRAVGSTIYRPQPRKSTVFARFRAS